jgi:hypothetical protein
VIRWSPKVPSTPGADAAAPSR